MQHKNLLLCLGLFLFSLSNTSAQQLPRYAQFTSNMFVVNPAAAGATPNLTAKIAHRAQWTGFEGGPQSTFVTVNAPISAGQRAMARHGVGFSILNDQAGALGNTGAYGTYAYHIPIGQNTRLSAGASVGLKKYRLIEDRIIVRDQGDPAAFTAPQGMTMDANIGLFIYNQNYFAGVSAYQILQNSVRTFNPNELEMAYQAIAGYRLKVGEEVAFVPAVRAAMLPSGLDFEGSFMVRYNNNIWGGLGYRPNVGMSIQLGGGTDDFIFSYTYEHNNTALGQVAQGSHEIMLGLRVFQSSIKRIAQDGPPAFD
jgi:type IX secretion system PorP/SprF family membrane protein